MLKTKKKRGRPKGEKKDSFNLSLKITTIRKIKQQALDENITASQVVEDKF
jgi:hypothetical protein